MLPLLSPITALVCAPTFVAHHCPRLCTLHLCCSEYPPTIYISMVRDTPTAKKIEANRKELTRRRSPVEVVQVRWGAAERRRVAVAVVRCGT